MRRIAAPLIAALGITIMLTAATPLPAFAAPPAAVAAPTQCVTVLHPPAGTSGAFGISAGPRGGVWFSHGATVDHVTARGVEEIPLPDPATANAGTLAWKPGGPLWFADRGNSRIGSIDPHGVVRTYDIPHPTAPLAVPQGIVVGPHPYVWFTDQVGSSIDRLNTVTGHIDIYPVPTPNSSPLGLTRGPDGALWFTERTAARVGRLTPDGTFTEWALTPGAFPNRITVGPDNAIWFTELNAGKLGRIDNGGILTEYSIAGGPVGITTGPGPYMYVSLFLDKALAEVDTGGNVTQRWELPGAAGPLQTATIHGAIWVTDSTSDTVYRVRPHCPH